MKNLRPKHSLSQVLRIHVKTEFVQFGFVILIGSEIVVLFILFEDCHQPHTNSSTPLPPLTLNQFFSPSSEVCITMWTPHTHKRYIRQPSHSHTPHIHHTHIHTYITYTYITYAHTYMSGYHADTPITIKAEASSKADSRPN